MNCFLRYAFCAALPLLSACDDGSDDYPRLLPMDDLLAEPELPPAGNDPVATETAVNSRADGLRARAEALRGPVIEPLIRRRIDEAGG